MTISNGTDLSASNSDHRVGRPSSPTLASHHVKQQPNTVTEFRFIRLLALGYLGISVLSIVATVVLRNHAAEVNSAVWTRGVVVALSAADDIRIGYPPGTRFSGSVPPTAGSSPLSWSWPLRSSLRFQAPFPSG